MIIFPFVRLLIAGFLLILKHSYSSPSYIPVSRLPSLPSSFYGGDAVPQGRPGNQVKSGRPSQTNTVLVPLDCLYRVLFLVLRSILQGISLWEGGISTGPLEGVLSLPTGKMASRAPIGSIWEPWLYSDKGRHSRAVESSLCPCLGQAGAQAPEDRGSRHPVESGSGRCGPGTEHGKLGTRMDRCWWTYIHPPLGPHGPVVGRNQVAPSPWLSCGVFWRQGIHLLTWGWGWEWVCRTLCPGVGCPALLAVEINHTQKEGWENQQWSFFPGSLQDRAHLGLPWQSSG